MAATRLRGERWAYDDLLDHGRRARLTHGASERVEVVLARAHVNKFLVNVHDIPTARGGETLRVTRAQVIGVRLRLGRQLANNHG